jgi:hypothetical protein
MSIAKYAQKENELLARLRAADERIAQAEADAGAAYADAEGGQSASISLDAVLRAKAEVPLIESAIRAVRARRLDAIRESRKSEAAAPRKQAAELRTEIARIEQKVRKHIESINVLQETQVTVSAAPGEPTAKSQLLETRATAIEQRAAALEADLPRDGKVTLDNVTGIDALIAAVLQHQSDSPSSQDVMQWATAVERKAGRGPFGENLRRYALVWKDGGIDTAESYIQVHSLARRPAGPVSGSLGYEIGSDIFRAVVAA